MAGLFPCQLFYFFAILDFVHENFGRLKAGNVMFVNNDSGIARNVARYLFLSFLVHKAAKSTDVDVLPGRHGCFYNVEKSFNGMRDIRFVYSGFFSDL